MKPNKIIFDENMEMYISPKGLNTEVCISIPDSLLAFEEELTEEHKSKIANFINNISDWYNKAVEAVLKRAKLIYNIEAKNKDLQLMNIFILFEQIDDELYGLEFRAEFDVEHGCGLQIRGKDGNFDIVKVGAGDVAFC